jgi:hypothetical protein
MEAKPRHSKLPWPWIVPAAAAHYTASAGLFGPKVKTCQRLRVKSYQHVGFRSSIDYNFSTQPFVVTTHSRFGIYEIKRSKMQGYTDVLCEAPGEHAANSLQRTKKTLGLRSFG